MNNNRGNNNRRRGRGNNRPNGGGQQLNRIDSRARGNAPQMLEKYRKLAHDAHLNGDRVTEEYYLQFSDHYFRVIADSRVRQEDGGRPRRDGTWQENGEGERDYSDETLDFSDGYDDVRNDRFERAPRPERPERAERPERPERVERPERAEQQPQPQRSEARPEPAVEDPAEGEGEGADASGERNPYEPPANPFVREGRPGRGLRQRRPRSDRAAGADSGENASGFEAPHGDSLDPSILPPAVSAQRAVDVPPAAAAPAAAAEADEAPKPRRRGRPPRQPASDTDETLQVVN